MRSKHTWRRPKSTPAEDERHFLFWGMIVAVILAPILIFLMPLLLEAAALVGKATLPQFQPH